MIDPDFFIDREIIGITSQILRRTITKIPNLEPDILWHYTKGDSLIKMLSSRKLWSTHISCMNDSIEVQLFANMMIREFERQLGSSLVTDKEKLLVRSMLDVFGPNFGLNSDYYVSSFSEEPDDLYQWRGYADDGKGYAIGFSQKRLMSAGAHQIASSKVPPILAPVTYSPKIQQQIVEQAVLTLIDIPRNRCRGWPEEGCDAWIKAFQGTWKDVVSDLAPLLKDATFFHEKEWRMIRSSFEEDVSNLQYLQRNSRLTRHLPIDFPEFANITAPLLPIEAIRIGPCIDYDVTAKSLELMVQTFGYPKGSISIMRSASPYRS